MKMTESFNISFVVRERKVLLMKLSLPDRRAAFEAAKIVFHNWMEEASLPPELLEIPGQISAGTTLSKNSALKAEVKSRFEAAAGNLAGKLKGATIVEPDEEQMLQEGCVWIPTPPTPPPPAGYYKCDGDQLLLSLDLGMKVVEGEWTMASEASDADVLYSIGMTTSVSADVTTPQ
ncbi:MAG: hypothetical protein H8E15_05205 [Planctomycetes bacterium]|nr:hypothetical protein [Planctomycetota bacterium]